MLRNDLSSVTQGLMCRLNGTEARWDNARLGEKHNSKSWLFIEAKPRIWQIKYNHAVLRICFIVLLFLTSPFPNFYCSRTISKYVFLMAVWYVDSLFLLPQVFSKLTIFYRLCCLRMQNLGASDGISSVESLQFIPSIRSGSFADIGPRNFMEDEHIRIDNLSTHLGSLFRCPSPSAFYGASIRSLFDWMDIQVRS